MTERIMVNNLALSIQQPWSWLVTHGYKDVENRTWRTKVRGSVLVHAGKSYDIRGYRYVKEHFPEIPMPDIHDMPRGGIVGGMHIADCVQSSESRWFDGPNGFILDKSLSWYDENILYPVRGRLGFFKVDIPYVIGIDPGQPDGDRSSVVIYGRDFYNNFIK